MPELTAQRYSRIRGTGSAQPAHVVTNDDLTRTLDTSDEWITTRTGIRERRIAQDETLVDLAADAAQRALDDAGIDGADIDLLIVATMTGERSPSTAARVAGRLGVRKAMSYDLSAACAGFTMALAAADQAIRAGDAERAVVIGAERMSDFMDWSDRSTAILMADGAGAAVLEASAERGVFPAVHGTEPSLADAIRIERPDERFTMQGASVLRWTMTNLPRIAQDALDRAGMRAERLAGFVPHQANSRIIAAVGDAIGVAPERTSYDVATSGNTSAASVPIALDKLRRGALADGGPVLLMGFGGGFSYAAQVVEVPALQAPA
ncbi:beta-ketoacyl-ACP synthase III [Arenivirga flava]|uniref:Beta-ketoacyl-[acyl-carrier-protein] synthase III n=1 Tax=Arenivirga flava TaxID=1930060 RepID=A0AA37UU86_9MICO|nr:beta-ketoacyl-ACP synthase III [Arenivirga flava]GMA28627.1 3-oxoacyl-[acyl-carrier-protein] synthase 3 protein 4 [Arenivirga flava]